MKAYVYILLCADGSIKLLYFEEFSDISKAFDREKQIQGWSRRKKEALINENYSDLFEFNKK